MPRELTEAEKEARGRLEYEIQRGMRIAALINDPVVKETMDGLIHGVQNQWAAEEDQSKREVLWYRFNALRALVVALGQIVDTGKMANIQLNGPEKHG